MTEFLIISTTVANKKDAEELVMKIVKKQYGACVHIAPITSYYKWKGKLEKENEFKVEIKTLSKNYKSLQNFILKNHKYELPEMIATKINKGYKDYLNWIEKQ